MAAKRYSGEFKTEAIKQVTAWLQRDGGSGPPGIASKTLYGWLKETGADQTKCRTRPARFSAREPAAEGGAASRQGRARHSKKTAAYFAKTSG